MKILSLDSSARTATVAICEDHKIIGETNLNTGMTHSQTLLPMVDSLLKQVSIPLEEIDLFAVSNGPGSFTGLRIGIATVKGLTFSSGKPCLGISTLMGLAYNLSGVKGYVCPCMDARCQQVYTALFYTDGLSMKRVEEDCAISIKERIDRLKGLDEDIYFVGDGAKLVYDAAKSVLRHFYLAPEHLLYAHASAVALAAWDVLQSTSPISSDELMPAYLRLPQAQRELKKKQQIQNL